MKTISYTFLTFTLLFAFLMSCSQTDQSSKKNNKSGNAVNVYNYSKNGLQLLGDISDEKSHLTYISLGEMVKFTGKTDSLKNREYYNIELSDGKTGWSMGNYLILNAEPGAVIEPVNIFERPDVINKTSKTFNEIDFVAITEENDDWYYVTGINNIKKGWISKKAVSKTKEDVAMAILAIKALYDDKGNLLSDNIEGFIKEAPYPESKVTNILKLKLQPSVEEEEIDMYEEETDTIAN